MESNDFIVKITETDTGLLLGTGFFATSEHIITCEHVVGMREQVSITFVDSNHYIADVVKKVPECDIAVLTCESLLDEHREKIEPLSIADDLSYGLCPTVGYPDNRRRVPQPVTYSGMAIDTELGNLLTLHHASGITKGYSGAPILTTSGCLMGIIVDFPQTNQYKRRGDEAFAIPASTLREVLPEQFYRDDDKTRQHSENLEIFFTNESFKLSKDFLKKRALRVITKKSAVDNDFLLDLRKYFSSPENQKRKDALLSLARLITSIRLPSRQSGQSVTSDGKQNLFAEMQELIVNSEKQIPFLVKGQTALGKSTIMSLFYCFLLFQFHIGQSDYIPFYIDVGALWDLTQNDYQKFREKVSDYALAARDICVKTGSKGVFLVDGPSDSDLFGYYYEPETKEIFDDLYNDKSDSFIFKAIYIIDSCPLTNTEKNKFCDNVDLDRIIYFRKVDTINVVKSLSEGDDLVKYYGEAMSFDDYLIDFAQEKLRTFSLPQIDMNFLSTFENDLYSDVEVLSLNRLYEEQFKEITSSQRTIALAMAHLLLTDKCIKYDTYSEDFSVDTFKLLTSQYNLLLYCVVMQCISVLKKYDETKNLTCLDLLYDKTMSEILLTEIKDKNIASVVIGNIIKYYDKVKYRGKSTLAYVAGRITSEHDIKKTDDFLSNKIIELEKMDTSAFSNMKLALHVLAKRSLYISKAIIKPDSNYIDYYVQLLLADDYQCSVNRSFQRVYYDDMPMKDFNGNDEQGKGFDFFNSFYRIGSRLKAYADGGDGYPLLEYDLFTLCNLFQVRTERVYIGNSDETIAFLYSRRHTNGVKHYIKNLLCWIEEYLKRNKETKIKDEAACRYIRYFCFIGDFLNLFIAHLEAQSPADDRIPIPRFDIVMEYASREINALNANKRGWMIKQNELDFINDDIEIINREISLESTGEHVYAAYITALVYLPEELPRNMADRNDYNKQQVLNTILIHHISDPERLDANARYHNVEHANAHGEEPYNGFFLLGTFSKIGNQDGYYNLWEKWYDDKNGDINSKIAKDIDRIQLLYRLCQLLLADKLTNVATRLTAYIKNEDKHVHTPIGKTVLKRVIYENPELSNLFNGGHTQGVNNHVNSGYPRGR